MDNEFSGILSFHKQLADSWANNEDIPASTIHAFIKMCLSHASHINNIEDRQELRYILRVWGTRLAKIENRFPDIDIDVSERQPTHLLSKQITESEQSSSILVGSLKELRSLEKKLARLVAEDVSDEALSKIFRELSQVLPGAISDIVKRQRRSQIDVLQDMIWAVKNNVMRQREFMEKQVSVGKEYVKEIWVNAWEILDLRGNFFGVTTRRNLRDGVRYCYFVRDEKQFERLIEKVRKDPNLGKEHERLLSCISISGENTDLLYIFDFALWNPKTDECEGIFIHWQGNEPNFYPMLDNRVQVAQRRMNRLYQSLVPMRKKDKIDIGISGVTAQLVAAGSSNGGG